MTSDNISEREREERVSMATRCGSLWFVLGVVGSHIMEEDHQEKQSHPHHVGEYCQLYVRYHFPLRKRRLRGVSPHSVTRRTASLASQPYLSASERKKRRKTGKCSFPGKNTAGLRDYRTATF